MTMNISHLLDLPDEMLLEICKYLLPAHVLYSFYGINYRLKACISSYYHHIALTDVTFGQCQHLCGFVLPEIGAEILSLSLSNCRSVLQGKLFMSYFSSQMSHVFPNLQKLILTCFAADEFEHFLHTLNNFTQLTTVEVYDLLTDQADLLQHVLDTNDRRWQSLKFKTSDVDLPTAPCTNLKELTISIESVDKLAPLLSFLPEIRQLSVTIEDNRVREIHFDYLSPLLHLKNFFLRCYNRCWSLEDVQSLLHCLPTVEYLSLQLSSEDERFVDSEQKFFQILPPSIRELHFSLRYLYDRVEEIDRSALLNARFPMVCFIDENFDQAFVQTTPYRFPLLNISSITAKQLCPAEHYRHVEMFYDYAGMSLAEAFPIIARCRRIKEIAIESCEPTDVSQVQTALPVLSNFRCLKRVWLLHSSREYQSLKSLLQAAPNLSELFIHFDNLLPIFDDHDTYQLLGQRIIHLLLLRSGSAAATQLSEEYVPALSRVFTRIRHLQIDVTNGPTVDSIVRSVLNTFQGRSRLISLVVEGNSLSDELKSNARQWLIDQACLQPEDSFDAQFKEQTKRFLLWM